MKILTHSQQQPQGPKTHKKKPTIRLTIRLNAPIHPFFTDSWSWMKSSSRHTLSNITQLTNHLRAVNLTETFANHTFQAPCCGFKSGLTTDLLFLKQSVLVSNEL